MRAFLASLVVGLGLLAMASSEAEAWTCRADGLRATGFGRSRSLIDAKLWALRQCERRSPVPVCTITWCR